MHIPKLAQKLKFPAPRRCSEVTDNGYFTRPYTVADVQLTKLGGGWFIPHYHDFANSAAIKAAGFGMPRMEIKLDKIMADIHNLPEEMQEALLEQLERKQIMSENKKYLGDGVYADLATFPTEG